MHKTFLCAITLLAAQPAVADPAFGFGVTLLSNGEAAVGVRIFSNDRAYKGAAALGLDYNLQSQSLRPSIGVAYLDREFYVDATVGIDLDSNELDFGLGIGGLSTTQLPAAAPPPTPVGPPVSVPTGTGGAATGGTDAPAIY